MEMKPVESSNIAKVGYAVDTKTLRLQFKSGETWEYAGVPVDAHAELMISPSIGRAFRALIKHHYLARKVEAAEA